MTEQAISPAVRTLRGIAPLIADLVNQVGGLRSRPDDAGRSKADEAPAPLNLLALDDADALFAHLANEVIYDAAWLDLPAPTIFGRRDATGTIIGIRAHRTAGEALEDSRALAEWLENRLELLPEHALDGLFAELRAIAKRHPYRSRPTPSTTAVCPDCRGSLLVIAPRFLADEQRVVCQGCGLELDEAEYARTEYRYAGILAAEKRKARSTAVRDRLVAKYAGVTEHRIA